MNSKTLISTLLAFSCASSSWANDNPIIQLVKQAEYELDTSVTAYFKSPTSTQADQDDIAFLTRFSVQSQTWFNDSVSAGFNLYATYSTQKHEYSGVFRNPAHRAIEPRLIDFNTAWLRYEGDDFSLLLGKDYIETGLAELYSPANRFGLYNIANPTQNYKIGVWHAGVDFFINDDTLSFKVMPVYERSLLPSVHSRWLGNSSDPEFTALAAFYQIEDRYRPVRIENVGYLIQYKGSRAGYDFFGLVHHGASIYPTLAYGALPNQRIKIDPLATSIAAGVLKVMEQWKFYAEAVYQNTDNHRDEDFVRYALGISYSDTDLANLIGFSQINTTFQWSGDESVDTADALKVAARSREARPFRNTFFAKIEIEHNHQWGYMFSATHNVESDFGLFAGLEYKPNDNLSLRLEAGFFEGSKDTHFGRWQDNDYLRLRTVYKF